MKEIQLTQGKVALVDDWNYEEINKYKWHVAWSENTKSYYATRMDGKRPLWKRMSMHRVIMKTPSGLMCDHINHDTLDNRESNLRNVTVSQNSMNRLGAQENNKLGERCISKRGSSYVVQVSKSGKRVFCAYFNNIEDAILARDEALRKFHGEFFYSR